MLLLLPPSETKRDGGGENSALDLSVLSHQALSRQRRSVLAATRALSSNKEAMSAALGLGPKQQFEVLRNRTLRSSPTVAALERYTGVLYDALDAPGLPDAARQFAAATVEIHSAMFGLLAADDPIPAYRLSHDSKLPSVPLRPLWRDAVSTELAARRGLILDLRSESYVQLGPITGQNVSQAAFYLRVVSEAADGRVRALNHFNKKGKGEFTRAVVLAGIDHPSVESLIEWARGTGIRLGHGKTGELELTV